MTDATRRRARRNPHDSLAGSARANAGNRYEAADWVALLAEPGEPSPEALDLAAKLQTHVRVLWTIEEGDPDQDSDELGYLSFASLTGEGVGLWEGREPGHEEFEPIVMGDPSAQALAELLDHELYEIREEAEENPPRKKAKRSHVPYKGKRPVTRSQAVTAGARLAHCRPDTSKTYKRSTCDQAAGALGAYGAEGRGGPQLGLAFGNPPPPGKKAWTRNRHEEGFTDYVKGTAAGYVYIWPYHPRKSRFARHLGGLFSEAHGQRVPAGTKWIAYKRGAFTPETPWAPGGQIGAISAHKTLADAKKAGDRLLASENYTRPEHERLASAHFSHADRLGLRGGPGGPGMEYPPWARSSDEQRRLREQALGAMDKGISQLAYPLDAEDMIRRVDEREGWRDNDPQLARDRHNPPRRLLPLASARRKWDADAARKRLKRWASRGRKSVDFKKYARAFFYQNPTKAKELGGYKLPFADVIGGRLKAVPHGVIAAGAAIDGARGGVRISESAKRDAAAEVVRYYKKMKDTPPERIVWRSRYRSNPADYRGPGGPDDSAARRVGAYFAAENPSGPGLRGWRRNPEGYQWDDWSGAWAQVYRYRPRGRGSVGWNSRHMAEAYEYETGQKLPAGTTWVARVYPTSDRGAPPLWSAHRTLDAAKRAATRAIEGR